ncbi:MAG: class B sortase [Defluviitaleaceae bacterium]|nr:class B sortase [Defluviitaleaceae bacterium]
MPKRKIFINVVSFVFAFSLIFVTVYATTNRVGESMSVEEEVLGLVIPASLTPFSANDVAMMLRMNANRDSNANEPSHQRSFHVRLPSGAEHLQTEFTNQLESSDAPVIDIPVIIHGNQNDNFVGTLYIPALGIKDSIFWTGDDFYLRRDYRGRNASAGELYIDGRLTNNLLAPDMLINGHNMNNGTKFGKLRRVADHDHSTPMYMFIKEYPSGRIFIYEIFAAQIVHSSATGVHLNFSSDFARNFYYRELWRNSLITTNEPDFNNPIVILNTCDSTINGGHLIVFAVMKMWV